MDLKLDTVPTTCVTHLSEKRNSKTKITEKQMARSL